ncbi:MAG: TldD/PmbA family protein [Chloroherpetonaceae bacterium]|nr:TldD/PmbA family protein [Chloroherpetonaceae bacterium]
MSVLSKEDAKKILDKVLSFSKAEECEASLSGGASGNIRYARNTVTTSGFVEDVSLSVSAKFGKRVGSASANELDDASIERCVRRAEELARLAPENPEAMPFLEPQTYLESQAYFEPTATITPDYRASVAQEGISQAEKLGMTAAGFFEDGARFSAMANSKGLFAYHKSTGMEFTLTVRTNDGTGSGYAVKDYNDVRKFRPKEDSEIAVRKAELSRNPRAIEPGKYTVILEPAALVSDEGLLNNFIFAMGARAADEGRSFFSKKGGGNKIGEKILDERVNIYSDPTHPEIPAQTWQSDGLPREKTWWIKNGVLQNLVYDRYWASQKGVKPIAFPSGIIFEGSNASLEDLIRDTRKGILVTRLWYIRSVDPQTLLYTGLTRDGTFYIENGKIQYAIKNMRFNESPVIMLNNLDALGKPERLNGNLVPPMRIRDFTFTSLSDAV